MAPFGLGICDLGDADPTPGQMPIACGICYGGAGNPCRDCHDELLAQDRAIAALAATVTGALADALDAREKRLRALATSRPKQVLLRAIVRVRTGPAAAVTRESVAALERRCNALGPGLGNALHTYLSAVLFGVHRRDDRAARWLLAQCDESLAYAESVVRYRREVRESATRRQRDAAATARRATFRVVRGADG